jgi:hypothetical protein
MSASAANPVRVLETNLYPSPTVAARNVRATQRHTATFDFLLTYIRPTAIVVHGDKAIDHLTRALNAKTLQEERFVAIPTSWGAVHVRAERHFSRGWSYARAEKLGVSLRRLCARLDGRVSTYKRKKT